MNAEPLDKFIAATSTRIPTVDEMISLCESLGIQFIMDNGKPFMKPCPECRDEALVLAKLFRREPFRTAVLKTKLPDLVKEIKTPEPEHTPNNEQKVECLWPGTGYIGPHDFPESGWPSGAYFYRKIGDSDWMPIPGRNWDNETKRGTIEGTSHARKQPENMASR